MDKVNGLIVAIMVAIVLVLSGCTAQKGMATGWSLQFSVVPVTQVDNQQQLGNLEARKL